MNVISTKAHGVMDYMMGILLIASPWLFNLNNASAEGMIPFYLGIGTLIYSLITNYELSIAKVLPMRGHLFLDECAGVLLAASPWLFHFSNRVYLPHLILGIAELGVAILTRTQSAHLAVKRGRPAHH